MRGSDGCPRVLICSLSCKLHRCAPSTRWQSSGSLGSVYRAAGEKGERKRRRRGRRGGEGGYSTSLG
eukprot:scaffold19452_cov49-Phaeocystis_antarctica.AAC.6